MKGFSAVARHLLAALILGPLFSTASDAQMPAQSTRLVLKGYDPVAYFTDNKAMKGAEDISFDFDEGRYLFSSANNRKAFSTDPDRYAPQFAGFCTAGLAKGMKAEANPEIFLVVNGKLYTFASMKAKDAALADSSLVERAARNWRDKK
ncbi:MAG: YHS domain protein [Pseudomonadota bacterium]|nr:YHS domain protein [Pseudomonadota bacterium]